MISRYIKLMVLAFAVLLCGLWAYKFFTSGRIVIHTNNQSNIVTLYKIDGSKITGKESKQVQGNLSVRLSPGKYIVSVESKVFASRQTAEIKARKTTALQINLRSIGAVESVIPFGAYGVNATNDQIYYVDAGSNLLQKIDGNASPASIVSPVPLSNLKWADSSFGIAEGKDGHLYKVENGQLTSLNVPFTYLPQKISYAVTKEHLVYVGSGSDIYVGPSGGSYKKVYAAQSSQPSLVAAGSKLAVFDFEKKPGKGEGADGERIITVVDVNGKTITRDVDTYEAAWSPDGKYLAVSGDIEGAIYNNQLQKIGNYPDGNVNNLTWLSENELLYGVSDSLWSYNLTTKKATVIAKMPLQGSVSGIFPGNGSSYLYINATQNSKSDQYILQRVSLVGQNPSNNAQQLSVFFPVELASCQVDYINFVVTRLVMHGTDEQTCLDQTSRELAQDDLGGANYKLVFSPSPGE